MHKIHRQKSLFLRPKISGAMLPCSPISAGGSLHGKFRGGTPGPESFRIHPSTIVQKLLLLASRESSGLFFDMLPSH